MQYEKDKRIYYILDIEGNKKRSNEAYTGLNKISDNIIEVFLFIGICYRIDIVERKILEKRIVR